MGSTLEDQLMNIGSSYMDAVTDIAAIVAYAEDALNKHAVNRSAPPGVQLQVYEAREGLIRELYRQIDARCRKAQADTAEAAGLVIQHFSSKSAGGDE